MTDETKNEAGPERNADKTIEIDELARRLMDLWQDQVTAITANPDLAAQMSRLMAAMPPLNIGASQLKESSTDSVPISDITKAWAYMVERWVGQGWWKEASNGNAKSGTTQTSATGTATAAPSSELGHGKLDEFEHRLTVIEQRLEQLAKLKPKRGSFNKSSSQRKPRRTRATDQPS